VICGGGFDDSGMLDVVTEKPAPVLARESRLPKYGLHRWMRAMNSIIAAVQHGLRWRIPDGYEKARAVTGRGLASLIKSFDAGLSRGSRHPLQQPVGMMSRSLV
jgi:hypothetical protein